MSTIKYMVKARAPPRRASVAVAPPMFPPTFWVSLIACLAVVLAVMTMSSLRAPHHHIDAQPYALRHATPFHTTPVRTTHVHTLPARSMPIRSDTSYRTIGFLTSRGATQPSQILPLYGAHAPHRRHRHNYHTVSDAREHLSVRLPVLYNNRDCTDEVACEELLGSEVVRVHGQNEDFTVTLY